MATLAAACAKSTKKSITSFSFAEIDAKGIIDETGKTIKVWLPAPQGTGALTAVFRHNGRSVTVAGTAQESGKTVNSFISPVEYAVTAADGSIAVYVVNVLEASSKYFISFSIGASPAAGIIGEDWIEATVPPGTDLSSLVANFDFAGKSMSAGGKEQESGKTPNDFRSPLTYRITAMDGSAADYSVSVLDRNWRSVEPPLPGDEEKDILSMAFSPQGLLHVVRASWKETGSVKGLEVLRLEGGAWKELGSKRIDGNAMRFVSLAFGADGGPFLACIDWTGGNEPRNTYARAFAFGDGGEWEYLSPKFTASDCALAISPEGVPLMAYWWYSYSESAGVQFAVYRDGAWTPFGVDARDRTAMNARLIYDPSGALYFAWKSNAEINVERYEAGAWIEAAPSLPSRTETFSFALDGERLPLIAYREEYTEGDIRVLSLKAGKWADLGRPAKGIEEIATLSLVPGKDEALYLGLLDMRKYLVENMEFGTASETEFTSRVFAFEAGRWTTLGSRRFMKDVLINGFAVDGNGRPCFHDFDKIYRYE